MYFTPLSKKNTKHKLLRYFSSVVCRILSDKKCLVFHALKQKNTKHKLLRYFSFAIYKIQINEKHINKCNIIAIFTPKVKQE
ncbi:hypothetical protein BROOK1789B_1460 [Bathymodiolus brooksi thiotrophic gill symbiont]|nr:hypothetical protein BROOK1789B_1460 [Bathymodiolus brooksi thiotrophic gill symbiont]